MALTITTSGDWSSIVGNQRVNTLSIAFDSSYDAGGESLTARDMGLSVITSVNVQPKSGYTFTYDYTNFKLLAYWTPALSHTHTLVFPTTTATGLPTVGTNDLGGTGAFTVTGVATTSATHGGVVNGTVTQIALSEVTAATNLATLTGVIVVAYGY